jgi:aspartokinase/homoserine dehydrogenase 1
MSDEELDILNQKAYQNNEVLRYVGIIENGKVSAKLISVSSDNPLASTKHTDNIISITTKFYNKTPLVIRGPGAGADVTAIGIVSDLIKLSNLL